MDIEVSGFAIEAEIGRGGFGIVYRARQLSFDRPAAIKVLLANSSAEEIQRRFAQECRAVGALRPHPNVVTVYSTGSTADGRPYLAMQYLGGGALSDRTPLAPETVVALGVKLADGLAAAHAGGVIHRDVKPSNVRFGADDEPVLVDFGISSLVGEASITGSDVALSLGYTPPEMFEGGRATPAVDVYSLGATLFAAVSGRTPFVSKDGSSSIAAVAARIVNEPLEDLRPLGVPDALCGVIETCMAKDPAARYASMTEVRAALVAISADATLLHPAIAVAPRFSWVDPSGAVVGSAGAAGFGAAVSDGAAVSPSDEVTTHRTVGGAPFDAVTPVGAAPVIATPVNVATPASAASVDAASVSAASVDAAAPVRAASVDAASVDAAPPVIPAAARPGRRKSILAAVAAAVLLSAGVATAAVLSGSDPRTSPVADHPSPYSSTAPLLGATTAGTTGSSTLPAGSPTAVAGAPSVRTPGGTAAQAPVVLPGGEVITTVISSGPGGTRTRTTVQTITAAPPVPSSTPPLVNHPPVLGAIPAVRTSEGAYVNTKLTATDPDGGPLVFRVTGLPAGIAATSDGTIYGPLTGRAVNLTTSYTSVATGSYPITVTVTDSAGMSATGQQVWTVRDTEFPMPNYIGFRGCNGTGSCHESVPNFRLLGPRTVTCRKVSSAYVGKIVAQSVKAGVIAGWGQAFTFVIGAKSC